MPQKYENFIVPQKFFERFFKKRESLQSLQRQSFIQATVPLCVFRIPEI